jgi:hypothetical protein
MLRAASTTVRFFSRVRNRFATSVLCLLQRALHTSLILHLYCYSTDLSTLHLLRHPTQVQLSSDLCGVGECAEHHVLELSSSCHSDSFSPFGIFITNSSNSAFSMFSSKATLLSKTLYYAFLCSNSDYILFT